MKIVGSTPIVRPYNLNQDSFSGDLPSDDITVDRVALSSELPMNFKTMDPKKFEPVTIGELELIEAIERANNTLRGINTNFKFSIHEETKAIMVKVINSDTQEVVREIPPEKILDMVAKMWEMAGIFVDRHI